MPDYPETWTTRRPAVRGPLGAVSAQHYMAARAGAEILCQGGNAATPPWRQPLRLALASHG